MTVLAKLISEIGAALRGKPPPQARSWPARLALVRSLHCEGRYAEAINQAREAASAADQTAAPQATRAELALWQGLSELRAMHSVEAQRHFIRAYELDNRTNIPLQLATYARIMDFRWPAAREVLPACSPDTGRVHEEPPDIVYFFMSQADAPHRSAAGIDYFELLKLSADSARRTMNGARVRLLTDCRTAVPEGIVDDVLRHELPADRLMVARLLATARHLESSPVRDTIFVDPAIYFMQDCRRAFCGDFDLGYTWRSDTVDSMQDLMPLYAGVVLAPRGRSEAAAAFMNECLSCFAELERFSVVREAYPQGIARWWGDQLAPIAVLGWAQFYATILPRVSDRIRVGDTVIRFLDASLYNHAVDAPSEDLLSGRYIVNFKGERKRAMPQFAQWLARRASG